MTKGKLTHDCLRVALQIECLNHDRFCDFKKNMIASVDLESGEIAQQIELPSKLTTCWDLSPNWTAVLLMDGTVFVSLLAP